LPSGGLEGLKEALELSPDRCFLVFASSRRRQLLSCHFGTTSQISICAAKPIQD